MIYGSSWQRHAIVKVEPSETTMIAPPLYADGAGLNRPIDTLPLAANFMDLFYDPTAAFHELW